MAKGDLIAERYRLERRLGRGGMGEVWQARHDVTERRCALKFLTTTDLTEARRRRFFLEARIAGRLDHPNVVQVIDVFELENDTPVMVLELLEGCSLAERLARDGKLEPAVAFDILLQIVSGVGEAHARGIVHRDLKPANVFLCDADQRAKVLDFGVAKLSEHDEAGITQEGHALGTPAYMAPEQCRAARDVDHRADIWAIGIMLYEMLAGERPLAGSSIGEIVESLLTEGIPPLKVVAPSAPFDVAALARRMLARDREDRPADLREVADVLRKHASVEVPAFGAVGSLADIDVGSSMSDVATIATGDVTFEPSQHTVDTRLKPPPKSRMLWLLGPAALAGALVIGMSLSSEETTQPAGDALGDAPAATPSASAAGEPDVAAEPSVAPSPALAVESATATSPSPAPTPSPPRPKRVVVPKTKPSASTAAPPSASVPAPPTSSARKPKLLQQPGF